MSVLEIRGLTIAVRNSRGARPIVRDVDLSIGRGEAVGLIGESGSGKSTVALAVMNYLAGNLEVTAGRLRFRGDVDLLKAPRALFGRQIAYVAQDSTAALNPIMRIGTQITEALRRHAGATRDAARKRALDLLGEVHLPDPERIFQSLPYQLSGGMQQRVCMAMALACDPSLLVLDEPTTGLDARTEGTILELVRELKTRRDLSVLLISHNLAAVADLTDRVTVMYAGRAVETGPTVEVLRRPAHRYSQMLLTAVPRMDTDRPLVDAPWQDSEFPRRGCAFRARCDIALRECEDFETMQTVSAGRMSRCLRAKDLLDGLHRPAGADGLGSRASGASDPEDVLTVTRVSFAYGVGRTAPKALENVSLRIRKGATTALIGESGSGKSTLARLVIGLMRPHAGSIRLRDVELSDLRRYPHDVCRRVQIVFQNVAASLHPAKRGRTLLSRPYRLYERRRPSEQELGALLRPVGLRSDVLPMRAARLSGGERQRVGLARASALGPEVLILDEAFSALDVSMKVRVARYLAEQARTTGTGFLLVTHELPFVKYLADDVVVLYRGWVCESGRSTEVLSAPHHPYTETLVWAARRLEGLRPARTDLFLADPNPGTPVSGVRSGCPFHTACPRKLGAVCETQTPPEQVGAAGHSVSCHIALDELETAQAAEYARTSESECVS